MGKVYQKDAERVKANTQFSQSVNGVDGGRR